jgi:hypothetical protein
MLGSNHRNTIPECSHPSPTQRSTTRLDIRLVAGWERASLRVGAVPSTHHSASLATCRLCTATYAAGHHQSAASAAATNVQHWCRAHVQQHCAQQCTLMSPPTAGWTSRQALSGSYGIRRPPQPGCSPIRCAHCCREVSSLCSAATSACGGPYCWGRGIATSDGSLVQTSCGCNISLSLRANTVGAGTATSDGSLV